MANPRPRGEHPGTLGLAGKPLCTLFLLARRKRRRAHAGLAPARVPAPRQRAAAHSSGPPPVGPSPGPRRSRARLAATAESERSGPATMRRLPRAASLLVLQLALLGAAAAGVPEARVSAPRSLVWGPGLQADVVLPVRYFYVQAVNSEGQNLTRSPPGSVQPRGPP